MTIDVDEGSSLDAVLSLPLDRERRVGVLDMDRFGIALARRPHGQVIGRIEQPGIAGFGREQDKRANRHDPFVVLGGTPLNVADLVGKAKTLAVHHTCARSPFNPCPSRRACCGLGHGTLQPPVRPPAGLCLPLLRPHRHSRLPDRSLAARARRLLLPRGDRHSSNHQGDSKRADHQNWVEAFARNHRIPFEWAEKGVRKEDFVRRWQRRIVRNNAYGVYFIFKSLEVGPTFRIAVPKYPSKDPNYRIVAHQRSRFTHYYFYIRDEVLGPIVMCVGSFFPFKTTYYLNGHSFIEQQLNRAGITFRKDDNAFLAVADVAALQAAADKLSPKII